MSESAQESQQVEQSVEISDDPRFFVELNEPILVWGLNLEGIGLPVLLSSVWIGLGMWMLFFGTWLFAIWFCKALAKNPTLHKEWAARKGRGQMVVADDEAYRPKVRILRHDGRVTATDWLAQRRLDPHAQEG